MASVDDMIAELPEWKRPLVERGWRMGRGKWAHAPSPGTMIRVCNCGNDLFYLTKEGHMCANCGTYQSY